MLLGNYKALLASQFYNQHKPGFFFFQLGIMCFCAIHIV